MRALLADRIADPGPALLQEAGIEVVADPDLTAMSLPDAVAESAADILVVRSTRVTADALMAGPLKLVIRAGAGFNTIDVAAASDLNISVANCPGKNATAVAELAFGLIIALDRHVPDNVIELRAGRWNKAGFSDARGLSGSTLGLVGTGHIGRAMIPLAHAFGMRVLGWSRSLSPARAAELGVEHRSSPLEVARDADVVSIHVALTPDTRHMVDAEFLEAMRPGAYLINTARAEVVDENALMEAAKSKGIRAGLDVFENEPASGTGTVDTPLFGAPGIVGTHHIGGATTQAHRAVAEEMARIAIEFAQSGKVLNEVGA